MQGDFILLDRSGSMKSLWDEAISSINGYVKKLAEDKVDTEVTLAVFDQGNEGWLDFSVLREKIRPEAWTDVATKEAPPRGMTPLNDAIGRIVSIAETLNPQKAAIIIMTDGHENSSRELNGKQAKALLQGCRDKGWQVIFLGANFDNMEQASNLGNAGGQTIMASAGNIGATMRHTATARGMYGLTGQSIDYDDAFKKAMAEKN